MKSISVKIDTSTFEETKKIIAQISIPRNRYVNDAINYYNKVQMRDILKNKLKAESQLIKAESLKILAEFENIGFTY